MTQAPDQPPDPPEDAKKDAKGRFLPGHKFARGRPKGSPNTFGPGFREKLLAGIARSGAKKAKKAGVNHKVDGLEYFVENLVDSNGGAAATLIAKLIPPEQPPEAFNGPGMVVTVSSVEEGQQFLPGNEVLAPFDFAREAWKAFNAGTESWKVYLDTARGKFTLDAFEKLSRVVATDRQTLLQTESPLLHLVPPAQAQDAEALTSEEAKLFAEFKSLTDKLMERAVQGGFDPSDDEDPPPAA